MAHKIKRITSHKLFLPAVLLGLILLGLSVTFAYAYTPAKTVTIDYLYFNNGTGEEPRQGFFSLEYTASDYAKRGFDFKNQRFTGLGDGAFYITENEKDSRGNAISVENRVLKFYGNNDGQGGLVDMGAVSIFETMPALQTYNRYGVDIKPGHVYSVYDQKYLRYALISVRSASWDSTPAMVPSLVLKSDPVDNGTGYVGLNNDTKTGTFGLTYSGPLPFNKTGLTWEYRRDVLNCNNVAWNKTTCSFVATNVEDSTTLRVYSHDGVDVSSNILTIGMDSTTTTPAITCTAGNSSGGDGYYNVCVGYALIHNPSGLTANVLSYNDSKLALSISGMPGNNTMPLTVYKDSTSSVGGNNGYEVTYKYTGISPAATGAEIVIASRVLTPTPTSTTPMLVPVPSKDKCWKLHVLLMQKALTSSDGYNSEEASQCWNLYSSWWLAPLPQPQSGSSANVPSEEEADDFSEDGVSTMRANVSEVAFPKFGTSGGKKGFKMTVTIDNYSGIRLPVTLISSCSIGGVSISNEVEKSYKLPAGNVASTAKSIFIPLSGSRALKRVNSAKAAGDDITCNFELLNEDEDTLSLMEADITWDGRKWIVSDTRNDFEE
jgi:hypothetical protein